MWKEVIGYEDMYEISNDGHLRDKRTGEPRPSYLNKTSGYLSFSFYKNGVQKMHLVHRLVAEHFILNPNMYAQVNHKDEDKLNTILITSNGVRQSIMLTTAQELKGVTSFVKTIPRILNQLSHYI